MSEAAIQVEGQEIEALENAWRAFPETYARRCSGGKFEIYKHIEHISNIITPAIYSGGGRFLIELPPRHGKSEFISRWLVAWYLEQFANKNVILTSYGDELAGGFGRWVRNHFATNPEVTIRLKAGSTAASNFETNNGGEFSAAGVNGPITGKGFHLGIVDDPFKNWKDANSPVYRKALKEWFESTFYTRQEPNATIIVLQTRWHHQDLIGFLKNEHKDKWVSITLPAFAGVGDALGREEGEVLCPERYDHEAITKLKNGMHDRIFTALYQQKPSKDGGTVFKRDWWQYYDKIPNDIKYRVQFWDTASKAGLSNDYSVCATWGVSPSGYYLLDLWRDKVEAPELEVAIVAQHSKWRPKAVIIEDKGSGTSMIQYAQKKTRIPVIPYDPKQKDKEQRAVDAAPTVKAKKCFLPANAPWLSDFLDEHEHFPTTDHDDQIDTTSMAVDYFNNSDEGTDENKKVIQL